MSDVGGFVRATRQGKRVYQCLVRNERVGGRARHAYPGRFKNLKEALEGV